MRKTFGRLLLGALVAVFGFGTLAEAATATHKGHHRAKHSSRVSSSAAPQSSSHKAHSAKKHSAKKKSSSLPHHPTTKPK